MRKTTLDVAREIAKATGLPQNEVYAVVKAYGKVVMKTIIAGGEVGVNSFGVFKRTIRKNRAAYNFQLGKRYIAPDKALPVFVASPRFKEAVKDFYNAG